MPEDCGNTAQDMAIRHASGPMQVLAGPGSGKTYLTIRRVRHLIRSHGVSPEHILVITFAKAAAQEMERRFRKLTKGAYPSVCFGTFHAVYYRILRQSGPDNLSPASIQDKTECLKHALKNVVRPSAGKFGNTDGEPDLSLLSFLLKQISIVKNSETPEALLSDPSFVSAACAQEDELDGLFPAIFCEYVSLMRTAGKIDFDDMILLCGRLLAKKPDVLSSWRDRFSYILVDEFQDISPLQYRILRLLAAPRDNLFVVGDDDQSIYGFRGAGPDIMRRFMTDYPQAKQALLSANYRCGEAIVRAAGLVIAESRNRFHKEIVSAGREKSSVRLLPFGSEEEEYRYLAECLKKLPERELADTAVIFRTNAAAASFSRRLSAERIPFFMWERTQNLFETPVAKDMIAYLRFAQSVFGQDVSEESQKSTASRVEGGNRSSGSGARADFFRIMNRPLRYICRESASGQEVCKEELLRFYENRPRMREVIDIFFAHLKRIAALRPYLAIDYIRKSAGYDRYLRDGKTAEEYGEGMRIADAVKESAAGFGTAQEWRAWIADYTKTVNDMGKERREDRKETAAGVRLMTMHASKGLEFERVWIPNAREGSLPIKKASSPRAVEEERRLFYVAMTRARTGLEILYYGTPSRFLAPLMKETPDR